MKILFVIVPLALAACQTTTQPAKILYPVKECGYVQEPIYGVLDRPASDGEVLGGAVIGGVIGNKLTDDAGGTIVGAIIGGAAANQHKQESVIVGYNEVYRCQTVYK